MRPDCATARDLRSIPLGACSPPCTAATSSHRTGRASFTADQSAQLPAEEIVQLEKGADYGWPECYYDGIQNKLVLAPEYGGDGKKIGVCADKKAPVASFPGHWAPNDLLIYSGNAFPAVRAVPLSPFMARGIDRRTRRAATTSCSSRSKTANPWGHLWFSPMDLPVR